MKYSFLEYWLCFRLFCGDTKIRCGYNFGAPLRKFVPKKCLDAALVWFIALVLRRNDHVCFDSR